MEEDGKRIKGGMGTVGSVEEPQGMQENFWDDLSGEPLEAEGVRKARQEELEEFRRQGVYRKVPINKVFLSLHLALSWWRVFVVSQQPIDFVSAEAQPHEDKEGLWAEQARLVRAD